MIGSFKTTAGLFLITGGFLLSPGAFTALADNPPAARPVAHRLLLPLRTDENEILDSNYQPVLLHGVNCPALEWSSDGQNHMLQTVSNAIQEWHVNIIRLPLSQDRWFGKAPEQHDDGESYRDLVRQVVDSCSQQSCYVVLDLHWSDCGEWGTNIGQHSMPDSNSIVFWKDCAAQFKNHPAVLFDLYNEPHDVTWNVWLNGGTIVDKPNTHKADPPKTYPAVGMQQLLDTVRATGAKNLVIAGGLDWAYDFSGILEGVQLFDRDGNGVVYANHAYNNKHDSAEAWIAKMKLATAKVPVIVSEFGGSGGPHRRARRNETNASISNDDWLLHVMQGLQDHRWSWIAWSFHPSAGPTLISNWNYTPTQDFGTYVKQALAGELPRYTPPSPEKTSTSRQ